MLGLLAFRWLNKKICLAQNNRAWWDFAQKCQGSWIFGKNKFWESVSSDLFNDI